MGDFNDFSLCETERELYGEFLLNKRQIERGRGEREKGGGGEIL